MGLIAFLFWVAVALGVALYFHLTSQSDRIHHATVVVAVILVAAGASFLWQIVSTGRIPGY